MATAFASEPPPAAPPPVAARRYRLSADQYEALIDSGLLAGERVELIGGELIEMAPQHLPHGRAKMQLAFRLRDAIELAGLPLEMLGEVSVRAGPSDVPEPDIVLWERDDSRKTMPIDRVRLIVEVCASTHDMDLTVKPRLYAAAGVPEYWVADLRARAVTAMWSPGPEGYAQARTVPFGGTIEAATLAVRVSTEGLG